MHKSDIDKLEDILINENKYKQKLKLREIELSIVPSMELSEAELKLPGQDPNTIRTESNTSPVEREVIRRDSDLIYNQLYKIVKRTPKFIKTLNKYEKVIYDYRYRQIDLGIFEWEDIANKLTNEFVDDDKTFSKSTTLRIRNNMLERLADEIDYILIWHFWKREVHF